MPLSKLASARVALYYLLGGAFLTRRTARVAEAIFRRGLRYVQKNHHDRFVDGFFHAIASTYDVRGDKATALSMLQKRIESDPQKAMHYFDLAEFYLLNDHRSLAIANYEKALQLETDEEWQRLIQAELDRLRSSTSSVSTPS